MKTQISVLIIGSDGDIGSALLDGLDAKQFKATGTSRKESQDKVYLDLSKPWSLSNIHEFEYVIIAAGITSNEECLNFPEYARLVNVTNTLAICRYILKNDSKVILLSTNNVFSGMTPFTKATEIPSPKNLYGSMKAEVEKELIHSEFSSRVTVLRLTKVISPRNKLISKWVEDINLGKPVNVFKNVLVAPIEIKRVVNACEVVMRNGISGIIQVSGEKELTMSEMAISELAKIGYQQGSFQMQEIESPMSTHKLLDHNSLENNLFEQ